MVITSGGGVAIGKRHKGNGSAKGQRGQTQAYESLGNELPG